MILLDGQGRPYNTLDSYNVLKCVPTAFLGGTTNARGNSAGTGNPFTLFNIVGEVLIRLYGVCSVNLAGATGTVSIGVTGNTALFLPVSTGTDFVANDIWVDSTPAEVGGVLLSTVPGPFVIANGLDIIETVATANITSGNIYYVCLWRPLTEGSSVASAV